MPASSIPWNVYLELDPIIPHQVSSSEPACNRKVNYVSLVAMPEFNSPCKRFVVSVLQAASNTCPVVARAEVVIRQNGWIRLRAVVSPDLAAISKHENIQPTILALRPHGLPQLH